MSTPAAVDTLGRRFQRLKGRAVALAALALLAAASPVLGDEPPDVTGSAFGVNVHAPQQGHLRFLLDKTAQAGLGWIRIDFIWALVEPAPGVEEWGVYDDIVAEARARDLRILALIGYTPAWATDGPEVSGVPRDPEQWADFCYRAASRYRSDILHWEVWNEPNLSRFWVGSRRDYVEAILVPAARAIRAASPEAQVGGPGLAHFLGGGRDWFGWLLDILGAAGEELDFLTHHAYDLEDPEGVRRKLAAATPGGADPTRWAREEPSLREVLDHADWAGPVWLTETGWVTTRLDERRQADQYRQFLELWRGDTALRRWLPKVFFYEIQDAAPPQFAKYGLLRVSGREKPSYQVLQGFITGLKPPGPGDDPEPEAPCRFCGVERPRVP